jgi:hypothetical protein
VKTRNPKHEIRNKSKARILKARNRLHAYHGGDTHWPL